MDNPDERKKQFVMLRQFRDLPDALAIKSILDSAGIESLLGDENLVRLDWFLSNLVGGVKLWIREEDVDQAESLIDQSIPAEFGVEGVGEFKQPQCPICGSLDISLEELNKPATFITLFLVGLPVQVKRQRWKCNVCGNSGARFDEAEHRSS